MAKIVLDTNVIMCCGRGCPRREECYRFALNNFFDVIAKKRHPYPEFYEPVGEGCRHYMAVKYSDN